MAQIKDTDDFWDEYVFEHNPPPPIEEVNVRKSNVRWICCKDPRHVWNAKVMNRRAGQGCAICAGKKIIAGVNDFASQFPDAVAQWDCDKNFPLMPEQVSYSARDKFWWTCPECGHSWQTTPHVRSKATKTYGKCPECGHVPEDVHVQKQNDNK